jgi:L-threonylcarbamoyladenylate synthase
MEILKPKNRDQLNEAVTEAATVLSQGGLIIYPTDTLYGIGVDATNEFAVNNVYKLKGRESHKPLSVIVRDDRMAKEYVEFNSLAENIAERMLPGPLTLILKQKNKLAPNVTPEGDTLGVRMPDSYFCLALAAQFGRPYTTTSANRSGSRAGDVEQVLEQLKEHESLIDLVIDVGPLDKKRPSSVLDVSDGQSVTVLRQGDINLKALQMVTLKDVS